MKSGFGYWLVAFVVTITCLWTIPILAWGLYITMMFMITLGWILLCIQGVINKYRKDPRAEYESIAIVGGIAAVLWVGFFLPWPVVIPLILTVGFSAIFLTILSMGYGGLFSR